jgi:hypothetical protein
VRCEASPAELEQLIFAHRLAGFEYDEALAVSVVWHDACVGDRGMLCEDALDFARVHDVARHLVCIVDAIDDPDEFVIVDPRRVSRAQPPVLMDRRSGGVGASQ